MSTTQSHFAHSFYIPSGTTDLDFYSDGIGAEELYCFTNNDGSVHVAELSIQGTIFHVHENNQPEKGQLLPPTEKG